MIPPTTGEPDSYSAGARGLQRIGFAYSRFGFAYSPAGGAYSDIPVTYSGMLLTNHVRYQVVL